MTDLSPTEWALLPMKRFVQFSGRAPRAEYWWFYLGTVVVGIITQIIDTLAGTAFVNLVVSLVLLVPTISVTVRRLHDTDRSGWWLVALLLPFLVVGFAIGLTGTAFPDVFEGMTWLIVIAAIAFILLAIALFVFMVTEGTHGPNSYGDDPYGPSNLEEVFA